MTFFFKCFAILFAFTAMLGGDVLLASSYKFGVKELVLSKRLLRGAGSAKRMFSRMNRRAGGNLEIVWLSGRVFHFGIDPNKWPPGGLPPQTPVNWANVWIAENPATKLMNVRSNSDGDWSMPIIKNKNETLAISLVYQRIGFKKTRTQMLTVGSRNISDLGQQFPGIVLYNTFKLITVVSFGEKVGTAIVSTVGKSWASMMLDRFPHGDPGALIQISPALPYPQGLPVYFNEKAMPDAAWHHTSVDGGVAFINVPNGRYSITASKAPYAYSSPRFNVESGYDLYLASPPYGIQGTNDSPPGEW